MKSQIEQIHDAVSEVTQYVTEYFSASERDRDPRIKGILGLLHSIELIRPTYSTGALLIEYDKETGRPCVNKASVLEYIRIQVEQQVFDATWDMELDLVDSEWTDTLIARAKGEIPGNPQKSAFDLESIILWHQEEIKRIQSQLNT